MPDVKAFDFKGPHGIVIDSGRHAVPGAIIGVGLAMYKDSLTRNIPKISTKFAAAGSLVGAMAYEGYDACIEKTPGVSVSGIADTCKAGYLDKASFGSATLDSISDVAVTTGFGALAAFAITKAAFGIREKLKEKPFYKEG